MGNNIVIPAIDLYSMDIQIHSLYERVRYLNVLLLEMEQRKYSHITQGYFEEYKKNIPQQLFFPTILAQYTEVCRIRDESRFIKQPLSKVTRFTQAIEEAMFAWTSSLNCDVVVQYRDFASTHPDQHRAFMQAVQIALPKTERYRATVIATGMMNALYSDIMSPKISNSILVLQNQIDAYVRDQGTFTSILVDVLEETYTPSNCPCEEWNRSCDCIGLTTWETKQVPTSAWVPNHVVHA